jgi:hypothetical protein
VQALTLAAVSDPQRQTGGAVDVPVVSKKTSKRLKADIW